MKIKILFVALIGLLLAAGLILAGCEQPEWCRGSCFYSGEISDNPIYGGCDVVSGGACYVDCNAKKAHLAHSYLRVGCNCDVPAKEE